MSKGYELKIRNYLKDALDSCNDNPSEAFFVRESLRDNGTLDSEYRLLDNGPGGETVVAQHDGVELKVEVEDVADVLWEKLHKIQ